MTRIFWRAIGAVAVCCIWAGESAAQNQQNQLGWVDGSLVFLDELNTALRADVSTESNAAIDLLLTIDESSLSGPAQSWYEQTLRKLQVDEHDARTDFVSLESVAGKVDVPYWKASDNAERALHGPWSRSEFPAVAHWLETNRDVLDELVHAGSKSDYYVPRATALFVDWPDERDQPQLLTTDLIHLRHLFRLLQSRAMARIHEGELNKALADARAMLHWSRLVAQSEIALVRLTASACARSAYDVLTHIASSPKCDVRTARSMITILLDWPGLPPLAMVYERGERLYVQDLTKRVDLLNELQSEYGLTFPDEAAERFNDQWTRDFINTRFDRAVEIAMIQPTSRQLEALESFRTQQRAVERRADALRSNQQPPSPLPVTDVESLLVEKLGNPAMELILSEIEQRQDRAITRVAVALAGYHAVHGAFPATLEELIPECLSSIPRDAFADKPIRYSVNGATGRVWSVGVDGDDNGGQPDGDLVATVTRGNGNHARQR